MAYNKIEQQVLEFSKPIVEELSLSIWDVEFKKEGQEYYLRLYIDKEGGVSIDECEAVSRRLGEVLDQKDPIVQAYYLEVSSAGLDRQLKYDAHFQKYIGHNIDIKLYAPLNKQKELTARLVAFENNIITVEWEGEKLDIPKDKAASVRLTVEF